MAHNDYIIFKRRDGSMINPGYLDLDLEFERWRTPTLSSVQSESGIRGQVYVAGFILRSVRYFLWNDYAPPVWQEEPDEDLFCDMISKI